jgi:hypothetical protein
VEQTITARRPPLSHLEKTQWNSLPFEKLYRPFVFFCFFPVVKVPRLRRLPDLGFTFLEYSRYSPDLSLRIIPSLRGRRLIPPVHA